MRSMYYYEVWVSSPRYHGDKALSYQYSEKLKAGTIISVVLQRQRVLAVVINEVTRPAFATKPIDSVVTDTAMPPELLKLIDWLKDYYPAPIGFLTALLLPSTLLQTSRDKSIANPEIAIKQLPPLTAEQNSALEIIIKSAPRSVLLHGDTGTGKTRVYIELIEKQIKLGKSAIVLTPEIGLTPQLAETMSQTFSNVVVLHSNLTPAERRNRWSHILNSNEPVVVVGPRSALFAPARNLGLIVMDEAHDQAYKQESRPRYQASRVAATLAKLHGAQLIFGTATPLVADYYTFEKKNLPIVRMRELAIVSDHKTINKIVAITDRTNFTRSGHLSNQLIDGVADSISKGEQSLIFLNRRGTARLALCESCGWTATCLNCDLPLTYHGDSHTMRCHVCNFSEPAPSSCPTCQHPDIGFRSPGTKMLETELNRLFPEARISRFDTDLKKADRLEEAYTAIKAGKVDILIGTQMLAKGLDLPSLGLVGIVVADTSLYLPDFSAEEQSYQLLSQIMGRVGRGHRRGRVIIQTYHPDHPALQAAVGRDYEAFYSQQVSERKKFGYPPFVYILKLQINRAQSLSAEKASAELAQSIRDLGLPLEIIGPSPAFHEKFQGKYNWQLVIKSKSREHLLNVVKRLPKTINYDIDPISLL